jgi:arylsulfatase A-like enzyme
MASAVDEVVANVTGALKQGGLWETTLLVFSSDNGAPGMEVTPQPLHRE